MPKMAPSNLSLDMLHAKKTHVCAQEHDHGQIRRNRHAAATAAAEGARSVHLCRLSLLLPLLLSVRTCHLTVMMPLSTNVEFLTCSMSKKRSEGTIFGTWHYRVCSATESPESFSTFHGQKLPKTSKNQAFWRGLVCDFLHFEQCSTKMCSHPEAQEAGSCQALSGSRIPPENPVSNGFQNIHYLYFSTVYLSFLG